MNKTAATPFAAALVGGVVVAAAFLAFGVGGGSTKTVVQQSSLSPRTSVSDGKALTARDIYKRDAPGVVNVKSEIVQRTQSPFGFPQDQQGEATGSGFVVDAQGYILTNAHVVDGASQVTVSFEDKKTENARIVGKDSSTDLALLKVDPSGLNLKPLQLGDSGTAQVGDPTIAIGNPFALDRTLTTGVVSALQRQISAPNGFTISNVIQTDAAINPGNSGGPLLDAAGRVIGINSQIATSDGSSDTGGGGNVGIGFAVPINTAKKVLPQLKQNGRVQRAYLGITGVTIDKSLDRLNLAVTSGILVQSVSPGSPAAKAGIHGGNAQTTLNGSSVQLGGDVLTKIDGKPIGSMDDVISAIADKKPGDSVSVTYVRDKSSKTATITLTQRPSTVPQQ
jgi:S1-C subfamily serine protease